MFDRRSVSIECQPDDELFLCATICHLGALVVTKAEGAGADVLQARVPESVRRTRGWPGLMLE
jgi:hypothetical protein